MDIGEKLRAISEPTRFKIVSLLLKRHHCSRSLSRTLGITESAISQHMAVLKEHDLVSGCRHGYHVHYILNRAAFEEIVGELQNWLACMDGIGDCHTSNPCQFLIDGGDKGCLYRDRTAAKDLEKTNEDCNSKRD